MAFGPDGTVYVTRGETVSEMGGGNSTFLHGSIDGGRTFLASATVAVYSAGR